MMLPLRLEQPLYGKNICYPAEPLVFFLAFQRAGAWAAGGMSGEGQAPGQRGPTGSDRPTRKTDPGKGLPG